MTPSAVLPDSDDELLRSLSRGDQQAIARLYQRYGSKMLAFAQRYVADKDAAEDVVVDLLRRWLEHPPNVRDFERLGAFLATSVYHAAVDWIRRDRAQQGRPPRRNVDDASENARGIAAISAEPGLSQQELAARLARALDRLSNSDRLLVETHYGQALTAVESMALLGISRSAFHQRLHRARTRLAQLLARDQMAGGQRSQDE